MSIKLSLLGKCRLEESKVAVDIKFPSKSIQLLALLAVQHTKNKQDASGEVLSRIEIARILWEDDSEEIILSRLRRLLYNLKKSIEEHLKEDFVVASQESLELSDVVLLDIEIFESLSSENDVLSMQSASELYRGVFAEEIQTDISVEFDTWLEEQRNYYQEKALSLYRQLVPLQLAADPMPEIRKNITSWLSIDSYEEQAHRLMMESYIREQKRNKAIAYYNEFRSFLQDEIGLEPDPQTQALYQQILRYQEPTIETTAISIPETKPFNRTKTTLVKMLDTQSLHEQAEKRFEGSSQISAIPAKLPVQLTSFVGRQKECQEILELLQVHRLVSILGPGGIGKTRLAQAVAEQSLEYYSQGVYFISLADTSEEQFLTKIATDLRLEPNATVQEIIDFLGNKNLLLVFDNCEHLSSQYKEFQNILESCINVKLLITSRQRLKLISEQIFEVEGLGIPENITALDIHNYSAIKLFLQRGRLVDRNFAVDESNYNNIVDICRMLHGLPLAIELAAAWVRNLSVDEIQAEVKSNLDFLRSESGQRPERQESLEGVFAYSWNLLSQAEQTIFCQLSIFEATISRQAAKEVTAASIQDLANLVDKSLLQVEEKGRYRLHGLLKQYAFEKLRELELYETTLESFRSYYVGQSEIWEKDVESSKQDNVVQKINYSYEDILKLWHEALHRGWFESLVKLSNTLMLHSQYQLSQRQQYELIAQALEKFPQEHEPLLRAELQLIQGTTSSYLSKFEESRQLLESSYEIFATKDEHLQAVDALELLAMIDYELGDYLNALMKIEKAEKTLLQAHQANAAKVSEKDLKQLVFVKGTVFEKLGQIPAAEDLYLEELAVVRAEGASVYLADILCNLAGFYIDHDRLGDAKAFLDEVDQIQEAMQSEYKYVPYLLYKGIYYFLVGEFTTAQKLFQEGIKLSNETEDFFQSFLIIMQARAFIEQKQISAGFDMIDEAFKMLQKIDIRTRALRVFLEAAQGFKFISQEAIALKLFNFVLSDTRSSFREKEVAKSELESIHLKDSFESIKLESVEDVCKFVINELKELSMDSVVVDGGGPESKPDTTQLDSSKSDRKHFSVLNDNQWLKLKPLLPPQPETGRKRKQDREVLNSYLYKLKTGKSYRDIPKDSSFASASTTQRWIETWRQEALLEQIELVLNSF